MNRAAETRQAGTAQGLTLILVAVMPIMAIAALVADLPLMLEIFRDVPNRDFLVPMVLTVPSACVALFSSVAGVMADRWGRRRLLIGALVAFSVLGVMPVFFQSLHAIIASRVVVGLAEAAILTSCNALLGDYFGEDDRRKWLARQQMSGPVFNALLALAGGALAAYHWRGPFVLYGLGLVVCVLVAAFIWEPRREHQAPVDKAVATDHFPWAVAARISAVTLGISIVFFILAIQQGRVFAALGVASPATNGALIMVASIGALIGAVVFGLLRRRRISELLALGLLAYGCGFLGISLATSVAAGVVFSLIGQVGSSIVLPALIAWTLSNYRFEHRGRGVGLWGACFFIGQFVSAPVLTLLERWRGEFLGALGVVGIATLLAAGAAWAIDRRIQRTDARVIP